MTDADFLWKLIGVGGVVVALISQIASLRRKPPITEELYKDFVGKDEIEKCAARCAKTLSDRIVFSDAVHAELFGQIRSMRDALSNDFKAIERGLGRIEGKMDAHLAESNKG